MLDQIARAVCSPAWTSMLAAWLLLWWASAVALSGWWQLERALIIIGTVLIVESVAALLFTYILLPLAPSRGVARAGLATQVLAVPLTSYVLARGRARPSRSC
jgi:hypothetical protein